MAVLSEKRRKPGDALLPVEGSDLSVLREIERKVLWLAVYMIHHANHVRSSVDGLKVGGHQASSASLVTLMTALYFRQLRPQDRVAVKPHASPVYHAIQYLMGRQNLDALERFRAFGGAQSYPSRTKDTPGVDFSTGSVGLGVAATLFASLVQDYVRARADADKTGDAPGRMIALVGDAELDEGNIYEALLDGWKYDVQNLWWIIDYNRQSLDGVVNDALFQKIAGVFDALGWRVTTLKYGKKLAALQDVAGGEAILDWIDACPNQLYSAMTFKGGAAWRERLKVDLGDASGVKAILDSHDDAALHALMTNLAGHDLESVIETYDVMNDDPTPQCLIAYTVKGFGLPLAGHKDNHAGLMTPAQLEQLREAMCVPHGAEWDKAAGLNIGHDEIEEFISSCDFIKRPLHIDVAPRIETPTISAPRGESLSTQEAFGKIMFDLAKSDDEFSSRVVTTSPDVTVSTNLGGWVNRRRLFHRCPRDDIFKSEKIPSAQIWTRSPTGQHIELGIAESNLFLLLGQLGLSHEFFGERLLPVGTLYDPFINRGLDSLNYACYQGARFMVVATPSGITLGPEGGAHQSIHTPVIGMAQPGLTYFEPAYADELAAIMRWGFEHMQADEGGSVYLRLSTRSIAQPQRDVPPEQSVIDGAYWLRAPRADAPLAIAFTGAIAPEALAAWEELNDEVPGIGLLNVTSADRAFQDWKSSQRLHIRDERGRPSHIERLLSELSTRARLVTVIDGAPEALSWLGAVRGHKTAPLGVERFGQVGSLPDLYREYGLDASAIVEAAKNVFLP